MFKKDAKASGKKGEFFSFLSGLFKKGVPWSLSEKYLQRKTRKWSSQCMSCRSRTIWFEKVSSFPRPHGVLLLCYNWYPAIQMTSLCFLFPIVHIIITNHCKSSQVFWSVSLFHVLLGTYIVVLSDTSLEAEEMRGLSGIIGMNNISEFKSLFATGEGIKTNNKYGPLAEEKIRSCWKAGHHHSPTKWKGVRGPLQGAA